MGSANDVYGGSGASNLPPELQMLRLASGHIPARAVQVFAYLGIADVLLDGAKRTEDIAAAVGADVPSLYRLLRFLSTIDVVSEDEEHGFSLTSLGKTLCSRHGAVIRNNTLLVGSDGYWSSLGGLLDHVRSGDNAFRSIHGESYFEYLAHHEADAKVFNTAMDVLSRTSIPAILNAYDFSTFGCVVDVAGGKGGLITGILRKYPSVDGVLYDSQNVLSSVAIEPNLADRLEKISGSFFEHIPEGGDCYILRQILHDWNDEKAITILQQCRKAMTPGNKLLIIEMAAPEENNSGNNWAALDVLMMLLFDGCERKPCEFDTLLQATGFSGARIIMTKSPFYILEAEAV